MSLGESRGVGMEGWLTVDFFVAAEGEGGSEGREKEKRTKVREKERKRERRSCRRNREWGMGRSRSGVGMDAVCGHPAPQKHSHPGARDTPRETVALPGPLIDKHSQNIVFHDLQAQGQTRLWAPATSHVFPERAGHPQAGCTWPRCCCVGVPWRLPCEASCRGPEESWPGMCLWAPTPGRCFPCAPHPPTTLSYHLVSTAGPAFTACSAKTQRARAAPPRFPPT